MKDTFFSATYLRNCMFWLRESHVWGGLSRYIGKGSC